MLVKSWHLGLVVTSGVSRETSMILVMRSGTWIPRYQDSCYADWPSRLSTRESRFLDQNSSLGPRQPRGAIRDLKVWGSRPSLQIETLRIGCAVGFHESSRERERERRESERERGILTRCQREVRLIAFVLSEEVCGGDALRRQRLLQALR